MSAPDLILHRGLFTTLDRGNPTASAVAIKDRIFTAVGTDQQVIAFAGPATSSRSNLRTLKTSRDARNRRTARRTAPDSPTSTPEQTRTKTWRRA
jgi:hypothetical protein